MKVRTNGPTRVGTLRRTSAVALASTLVAVMSLIPTPATAITRTEVVSRAQSWVKKKIRYSQSAYYKGYRRDCSGLVSMAWRTGKNYTSSTLRHVARRVPISKLRPGDVVHTPGHVAVFVRWKSRARGLYVAAEQTHWGDRARQHVRAIGHNATALRYRHIAAPKPETPPVDGSTPDTTTPLPSDPTTGTLDATPSLDATSNLLLGPTAGGAIESTLTMLGARAVAVFELTQPTASVLEAGPVVTTRLAMVPLY